MKKPEELSANERHAINRQLDKIICMRKQPGYPDVDTDEVYLEIKKLRQLLKPCLPVDISRLQVVQGGKA